MGPKLMHPCGISLAQVTLGFLFTISFAYPLGSFALRLNVHSLLFGETESLTWQHAAETIIPFVIVLTGALFITNLGVVYGLIGSIASCSFFLLFPPAMYLHSKSLTQSASLALAAKAVFGFGVAVMVTGVLASLSLI